MPSIGVQKQTDALEENLGSVAGYIEKAIKKSLRPHYCSSVTFSSRTDKGVHALCNTAHVDLSRKCGYYDPDFLTNKINKGLRNVDISVQKTLIVPPQFHARYNATHRTYLYRLAVVPNTHVNCKFLPVTEFDKLYLIRPPFDEERVLSACKLLEGMHDFGSFASVNNGMPDRPTIRTISSLSVTPGTPLLHHKYDPLCQQLQYWDVTVSSRGFLYKQVRKLVGVLVAVGQGVMDNDDVQYMLDNPKSTNYHRNAVCANPCALFLLNVQYPPESLVVANEYDEIDSVSHNCLNTPSLNPDGSLKPTSLKPDEIDSTSDNSLNPYNNS